MFKLLDNKNQRFSRIHDEISKLADELGKADEAQKDYERKKKAKGEKVNYWKMSNAIGQRKKVKFLGRRLLAMHFSLFSGSPLDKPAFNEAKENLEEDAIKIMESDKKGQLKEYLK